MLYSTLFISQIMVTLQFKVYIQTVICSYNTLYCYRFKYPVHKAVKISYNISNYTILHNMYFLLMNYSNTFECSFECNF